jgi:hypothetical protein
MMAIATGMRIGWRKAITFAPTQTTVLTITMRRRMKTAVRDAHIVFRCQGVGYLFTSAA